MLYLQNTKAAPQRFLRGSLRVGQMRNPNSWERAGKRKVAGSVVQKVPDFPGKELGLKDTGHVA